MIERSEQGTDQAAAVGGTPPRTSADPTPVEPARPFGWAASAPRMATGSRTSRPLRCRPRTRPAATRSTVRSATSSAAGAAPTTRSSAWTWLLFAALGFLGGQVLAVLSVSLSAAVSGNLHALTAITKMSEPPTWYIVSTLIGLWAGFFGAAWLSSSVRGTHSLVRDMGLRFRWIDLVGVPIGVGGQILVALMYIPIAQHVSNFNQRFDAPSQKLTGGSHGAGYTLIALCTVVGAPFFEELFFRGVLLRALARLFGTFGGWVGPALAIVITGVLFGLAHAESLQLLGWPSSGSSCRSSPTAPGAWA